MEGYDLKSPVTIDEGPASWQVLQQDGNGVASVTLSGRWFTILKRKRPEVRVSVCREGAFAPISRRFDWTLARTTVDRSVNGEAQGKCGRWAITLKDIPRGGPYRIQTKIGSVEDAIEWRRSGEIVNLLCVGDVWLIAGQSNAEGYGRDPVEDPPEIGVHQFTADGWSLGVHLHNHSPWLAFARKLKRELGYPIGLIPTAVGGSAVSRWDPGQEGPLFEDMKRRVQQSGGRIKGCVWYQGESDTGIADYPLYKVRFKRFVKGLRRLAGQSDLPLITVQLNRVLGVRDDESGWEAIRESQRQLAHEGDNLFVISIFEAGLCDGIHISSIGNLLVAERAVGSALGGVYGRDIDFWHPECTSVRRVSARTLDLRFDHVAGRLDYECAIRNGFPFAVRDEQGDVPVAGYRMRDRCSMRIELGRSLAGKTTVTGAPGCCPSQDVPKDISGYRGMLAFTVCVENSEL